jgi:hypothetical protein
MCLGSDSCIGSVQEVVTRFRTGAIGAVLVAAALFSSSAAVSSGGDPAASQGQTRPVLKVRTEGRAHSADLLYTDWAYSGGEPGLCGIIHEDFGGDPPSAIDTRAPISRVRLQFGGLPERPKRVSLLIWSRVGHDGNPMGQATRVRARAYRRVATRRWRAKAGVPDPATELFVRALGRWPKDHGCGPRVVAWEFRLSVK